MSFGGARATASRRKLFPAAARCLAAIVAAAWFSCAAFAQLPVRAAPDAATGRPASSPYGRLAPLSEKPQTPVTPSLREEDFGLPASWQEGPVNRFTHSGWIIPDRLVPSQPVAIAVVPQTLPAPSRNDGKPALKAVSTLGSPVRHTSAKPPIRRAASPGDTAAPWIALPSVLKPTIQP